MIENITLITIISILLIVMIIVWWISPKTRKIQTNTPQVCSASICGSDGIDPVSEPSYNMKQIIKQSILLEEHLVEPKKRCRDCIIKHFNHIIGLQNEALGLAGENADQYPLLIETTSFYSEQFEKWLESYNDEKVNLEIAGNLREVRKQLVSKYYSN